MQGRSLISDQDYKRPTVRAAYWLLVAALTAGTFVTLFPFLWMISSALKPSIEIFRVPPTLLPETWEWGNFVEAWRGLDYAHYFLNTIKIALGVWVAAVGVSALAAYSFSKLRPWGGRTLMFLFLSTLMVPATAYLIPQFLNVMNLPIVHWNLLDTYWAIWLPAIVNPFNLFLLKNAFDTVPSDLIDAARVDGASELRTFFGIVLPLSKPILSVLSIFTFSGVWNDFFWPMVVISTQRKLPIMVALYNYTRQSGVEWNLIMSAQTIVMIPPIGLFLLFQRYIVRGITMTGLKG